MVPKFKLLVVLICIVLSILPFVWLKPGELELGGDSNRLFFYDPGAYMHAESLFSIEPEGLSHVRPGQALIPFLIFLQLINYVFHSPYILMNLINSMKLAGSFLFVYLIIKELLKPYSNNDTHGYGYVAGILAGLFYTFSPAVGANMHVALLTHNQVFLNPLMAYLLLRFLITHKNVFLWIALLVTLIFSPNFSLVAPPPPFAFYPLVLLFLGLYTTKFLNIPIPWKKLLFGLILFLGLHAFHIIPVAGHVFDPDSYFNERILDASTGTNEALNYFNAVRGLGKVSRNIFYSYADPNIRWSASIVPFVVIMGFILIKKIRKDLLFLSTFFFAALFLLSANITDVGLAFYRKLFYIPGFGMFRVFYGQWQWVFAFFYALLFGYLLFVVLVKLRFRYAVLLSCIVVGSFVYGSWTFISGAILKTVHRGSQNMTSILLMNPDYEKSLAFISELPDDGKIINFPFTDYIYQVVAGTNNGAYIGVSPTAYLTGKRDFSGYPGIYPYPEIFLQLIREKRYDSIQKMFGLLNIRYIFYSSDPKVYKNSFPEFPYSLFGAVVTDSQALADLVSNLAGNIIFEAGDYHLYEIDKTNYLPHFYVPTAIIPYDANRKDEHVNTSISMGYPDPAIDPRVIFMSRDVYRDIQVTDQIPQITYKRVNPTKYTLEIKGARSPYLIVFSDAYNTSWKLFISKNTYKTLPVRESYVDASISESPHENIFFNSHTFETLSLTSLPEDRHIMVNGYANAWLVRPEDASGSYSYEIIVEMTQQRLFYYGLAISAVSFGIFTLYGVSIVIRNVRIKGLL